MQDLIEFLEVNVTESRIRSLSELVHIPLSINRYRKYGIDVFDRDDIAYVRQLGFETSTGIPPHL